MNDKEFNEYVSEWEIDNYVKECELAKHNRFRVVNRMKLTKKQEINSLPKYVFTISDDTVIVRYKSSSNT